MRNICASCGESIGTTSAPPTYDGVGNAMNVPNGALLLQRCRVRTHAHDMYIPKGTCNVEPEGDPIIICMRCIDDFLKPLHLMEEIQ